MPHIAFRHRLAGKASSLLGSVNIALGALFGSASLHAKGHRLRVIGVLQQSCAVDRRTVNAFIDRYMLRQSVA
jgi:uncharacterized protein YjbJ (UPF0337 family)